MATLEAPTPTSTRAARRRYDPAWDDWNPPRRWPGVLLSCVIVLAFLGVVIWHFRPHPAPVHVGGPTLPAGATIQPTYVVGGGTTDVAATFVGKHDRQGLAFSSSGGLLVLHATCACAYNFDVTIDQGFDAPVSVPITGVGDYDDASDISLPAGNYQFSVVGDGPWKLQVIEPQPNVPLLAAPFKYFSEGDAVLGPFSAIDKYLKLAFLSKGHGLIVTNVLNGHGISVATPFFGKSPYEEWKAVRNPPGPYYVEITAVGFWEVWVQTTPKFPST